MGRPLHWRDQKIGGTRKLDPSSLLLAYVINCVLIYNGCSMYFCFQFHADLYHMVLELSSDAGRERITTDFRFSDAVNQILSATKVVTYS